MALRVNQNTLLPGEFYLYDAAGKVCNQSSMMLNRNILFTAKSTADEFIFYNYLLDKNPIIKRHCN